MISTLLWWGQHSKAHLMIHLNHTHGISKSHQIHWVFTDSNGINHWIERQIHFIWLNSCSTNEWIRSRSWPQTQTWYQSPYKMVISMLWFVNITIWKYVLDCFLYASETVVIEGMHVHGHMWCELFRCKERWAQLWNILCRRWFSRSGYILDSENCDGRISTMKYLGGEEGMGL